MSSDRGDHREPLLSAAAELVVAERLVGDRAGEVDEVAAERVVAAALDLTPQLDADDLEQVVDRRVVPEERLANVAELDPVSGEQLLEGVLVAVRGAHGQPPLVLGHQPRRNGAYCSRVASPSTPARYAAA